MDNVQLSTEEKGAENMTNKQLLLRWHHAVQCSMSWPNHPSSCTCPRLQPFFTHALTLTHTHTHTHTHTYTYTHPHSHTTHSVPVALLPRDYHNYCCNEMFKNETAKQLWYTVASLLEDVFQVHVFCTILCENYSNFQTLVMTTVMIKFMKLTPVHILCTHNNS